MSYLIENQVIEGFSLQLESPLVYGAYTDVLIALEVGKTYSVSWDGVLYLCTAIDVSAYGNPGDVALGDVNYVFGGESTGEPFAIGYGQGYADGVATGVFGNTWYSKTAESSHTVSVALYVEPEEEQEGIVLKDRNGNDVAYYGIETVTFDTTTEGKQQTYSKGVVAEGVEVTLALADGDQVIQAPDGHLVKEATIKKPENLLPENIKKGENVAGVTGTFEGNLLEDLPIELDFSAGDQTLTAPDGYSIKSAIIAKPENLIPDNIREGEIVAGILGTMTAGSNAARIEYTYDDSGNLVGASFVNMTKIHDYALYQQENVTTVDFEKSPNINSVGRYAFYYCALPSLSLPDGVTSIGDYAFYNCSAMSSITFTNTLKTIGNSAFSSCSKLKTVYFEGTLADWLSITFASSGATPLRSGASLYIDGVKLSGNVVIPDTVTSIGQYAFYYLVPIKTVEIHDSVTSIGRDAFRNAGLTSVEIPDSVTSIGLSAFGYNTSLTSVVVGSGVTSFGSAVFSSCTKLSSVTLKEGLTIIGDSMFNGCSALESITIPASVTKIGSYAFSSSGLSSVKDGGSTGWYISTSSSATSGTSVSLTAYNLSTKYHNYYWFRNAT